MDLAAAKVIGAGLAAIGVGMAATGVGNVFGSFLQGALRNPAAADGQQGRLFIGFAAAERLDRFRGRDDHSLRRLTLLPMAAGRGYCPPPCCCGVC
jgi:F-type H+-transporting ATPase subunit c